jgi:hypothetical protein
MNGSFLPTKVAAEHAQNKAQSCERLFLQGWDLTASGICDDETGQSMLQGIATTWDRN